MILASSLLGDKELVVMKNNKITSLPNNEWPSRPKFALIAPGRCTLGPQDFISSSYLLAHNFCGYLLISGSFYWDDLRKNVCSVFQLPVACIHQGWKLQNKLLLRLIFGAKFKISKLRNLMNRKFLKFFPKFFLKTLFKNEGQIANLFFKVNADLFI